MQIKSDKDEEPVRSELGLLLLLVGFGACGLLTWTGLFLAVQWSVSTAWTAVVAQQAAASSAQIPPALSAAPALSHSLATQ
jgi:hypothetical protein